MTESQQHISIRYAELPSKSSSIAGSIENLRFFCIAVCPSSQSFSMSLLLNICSSCSVSFYSSYSPYTLSCIILVLQ